MNWQWLDVTITHSASQVGCISISAELWVDQKEMADILDIGVLFQAVSESGRYPLFTCGCGCFGCGGYYVDIECIDDAWIMRNSYHRHDANKLVDAFEYRFSWRNVYEVATRIRDYISRIREASPDILFASGTAGTFDAAAILAVKPVINLREGKRNQDWSDNYYALIEREAERLGKVFRWYSEESNSLAWPEKELEMCDASGWLFEPEEAEDFDRCSERYYRGEEGTDEDYHAYYPRIRSVYWSIRKYGTIVIEFGPEEW